MAKQCKSLAEIQKYLQSQLAKKDFNKTNLKNVTAEAMHDVIEDNVYDAFSPKQYQRRAEDEGFLDMDNMVFTNKQPTTNGIALTFENITTGNDSMSGQRLDDLFENGNGKWDNPNVYDDQGRLNSSKRPFIEDTVDELHYRKNELVDALKKDLKNDGFDVK